MKSDLDALMQRDGLDALLVVGGSSHNPAMAYFIGSAHLTQADLIKKRGAPPILFCSPIERDEAARSGLEVVINDIAAFTEDLRRYQGNVLEAQIARYERILRQIGLTEGRVALFGHFDAAYIYGVFRALEQRLPGLTFVGQVGESVLLSAMATKSPEEIERIRCVGQKTCEVIAQTAAFLTAHKAQDGVLIGTDGRPLTIGEVRRRITLWLAERNLEAPQGFIFASGYDAGVPHSVGRDEAPLRLGETIIFDIYPCELGGGYYYDITRTWCLGYAPPEVQALYEDVLAVYRHVRSHMRVGTSTRAYQVSACDLFEARGHVTLRSNPQTLNGYMHGLGHGVGLNIHESPRMSLTTPESETLQAGNVITLEPGLYYPERQMGVRLEDTLTSNEQGLFEPLVEYPLDLILPLKG